MSYTRDEVRFLIAHQGDISDAEQGLQMNKNTLIADMGVLRGRFGDHARAVGELLHARRAASENCVTTPAHAGFSATNQRSRPHRLR